LGSTLCDEGGSEIGKLLRLQSEELISGLGCLQGARCRLAGADQRVDARLGVTEVRDDTGLHRQGILERADAVLPSRIRIGDHAGVVALQGGTSVAIGECALDRLHVEGDPLGLAEQSPGRIDLALQRGQGRLRQAGQVLGLIDEAGRLLLDLRDLIVDLLQRTSGLEDVRRVVGRIVDDPAELSMGGRCEDRCRQWQAGNGAGEHGTAQHGHGHRTGPFSDCDGFSVQGAEHP
jgi:hypothetical protein